MKKNTDINKCLTQEQLLNYVQDKCTPVEVKAIDTHLWHCDFCSEALEGALMLQNVPSTEARLNLLDAKIDVALKKQKTKKSALTPKFGKKYYLWAAAASVATLVVGSIIFFRNTNIVLPQTSTVGIPQPTMQTESAKVAAETPVVLKPNDNNSNLKSIKETKIKQEADVAVVGETPKNTTNTGTIDINSTQDHTTQAAMNNTGSGAETNITVGAEKISTNKSDSDKIAGTQPEVNNARVVITDAQTGEVAPTLTGAQSKKKKNQKSDITSNYPGAAMQNSVPRPADGKVLEEVRVVGKQSEFSKNKNPDNGLTNYQLGMAYHKKQDYVNAISELNIVLKKNASSTVYENTLWYLADSYLKSNKKPEAKLLLQRIVKEKTAFSQQAIDLLKDWKE